MEIEICQVVRKNDKAEEVTLFIKGIGVFLCFMKIGGKVMVVSRWSHGTDRMYGGNSLWLPKDVYNKALRTAAAILNEKPAAQKSQIGIIEF